jgi:hypothetical protein
MNKTDIRVVVNNLTKLKSYFYKIKKPLVCEELEYMKALIVQQDKELKEAISDNKKIRLAYIELASKKGLKVVQK